MEDPSNEQPEEPIIDREVLAAITTGDTMFEKELLKTFLDAVPNTFAELQVAVSHRNWELANRHAHTMKGSCRSVGSNPVADAALSVEYAARDGDEDRIIRSMSLLSERSTLLFYEIRRIIDEE